MTTSIPKQLLHLVFGGELTSTDSIEFKDLSKLDLVGMYPNFAEARRAWAARRSRAWTMPRCAISWSISTG